MSIDRVFHNEAAVVSNKHLPYFTVLFLLEVSSISFTDLSCLLGRDRFSKFDIFLGVSPCKDLEVRVNSLNWHRFTIGSQCNCLRIGVICVLVVGVCIQQALQHSPPIESCQWSSMVCQQKHNYNNFT